MTSIFSRKESKAGSERTIKEISLQVKRQAEIDELLKILFRRFWKVAVLFCFLLAAAMMAVVLLLQVFVDREGIRYAQQYYSYIGTVKQSYAKEPDTQVISSEALEIFLLIAERTVW